MDVYIQIKRNGNGYKGPRLRGDNEVERAVLYWARECEWPRWFARNVVVWRKSRGLWWKTCGEAKEVR